MLHESVLIKATTKWLQLKIKLTSDWSTLCFFFGLHQFFFSLEKDITELVKALQILPAHLTVSIMHVLFFSTPLKI